VNGKWCCIKWFDASSIVEQGENIMALDLEAIRKKLDQLSGVKKTSSVQMWKADVGDYRVRVLPWKNSVEGLPFLERSFYYLGDQPGFLAPCQFNKPDPINDMCRELFSTKNLNDRAMAKTLMPRMRAYAAIIVRGDEEKGPMVWSFNKKVEQELLGFILDSDYGDITDLDAGFDIKVKIAVSAKTFNGRKYNEISVTPAPKSSPLSTDPELVKKWLDTVPNIDDMWQMKSYDEVKQALKNFLEGGQEGVIASEQHASMQKIQNDELSKLEDEIKAAAASETPEAKAEKKRRQTPAKTDTQAALNKGFDELDKELEDLQK
jgi:hypothetical protein